MSPSPMLILFARTHFTVGDCGWRTGNSVIPTLHRTPTHDGIALVTALEDVQPGRRGRFVELSPENADELSERL